MNRIVIVGAGGHARVLIDVLASRGVTPLGVVDPRTEPGTLVSGVEVLGDDTWLDTHRDDDLFVVIGLGSTGSVALRESMFDSLRSGGFTVTGCVHQSTIIGAGCRIDATAQILPGCVINNSATIGTNVVVYSGTIVEHDCVVGDHAYLSPGVTLCGGAHVGRSSFVGAGATVLQGVHIGANAVVAAGAVVTRDVADGATVMGVPAKVVDSAQ